MKIGFVKLQREIQGTWIHKNPLYFKAYCDILFTVNWESKYVLIDNKKMLCGVGESLLCLNSWAKIFGKGWDKSKVRRFFKRLADSHIVETQNERKTTRLKLVGIDLSADERHPNATEDDTQSERKPTPTKEGRRKKEEKKEKEEDSLNLNDKRVNSNLPFDVVSSSQTIKATFEGNTKAIDLLKEAYGVVAIEQDIKTAMHTFSTVAIASYDNYRGIRDYTNLCNKFIDWIPKSIDYEKANKGAKKPKSSFYGRNNQDKPATFSFNTKVTNGS
jgi:hypothetical protein|tara:strand:- start:1128 stop:1949 length:822 start_codon:yes stop_codon:yes gene_type:complete